MGVDTYPRRFQPDGPPLRRGRVLRKPEAAALQQDAPGIVEPFRDVCPFRYGSLRADETEVFRQGRFGPVLQKDRQDVLQPAEGLFHGNEGVAVRRADGIADSGGPEVQRLPFRQTGVGGRDDLGILPHKTHVRGVADEIIVPLPVPPRQARGGGVGPQLPDQPFFAHLVYDEQQAVPPVLAWVPLLPVDPGRTLQHPEQGVLLPGFRIHDQEFVIFLRDGEGQTLAFIAHGPSAHRGQSNADPGHIQAGGCPAVCPVAVFRTPGPAGVILSAPAVFQRGQVAVRPEEQPGEQRGILVLQLQHDRLLRGLLGGLQRVIFHVPEQQLQVIEGFFAPSGVKGFSILTLPDDAVLITVDGEAKEVLLDTREIEGGQVVVRDEMLLCVEAPERRGQRSVLPVGFALPIRCRPLLQLEGLPDGIRTNVTAAFAVLRENKYPAAAAGDTAGPALPLHPQD